MPFDELINQISKLYPYVNLYNKPIIDQHIVF